MSSILKKKAEKILAQADVKIDGDRPWDIVVNDERFYKRALLGGSLGLGESYMDGWWDVKELDAFFFKVLRARLNERVGSLREKIIFYGVKVLVNHQSKTRAFEVGERHYDIGNDLYQTMLDKRMTYTCGYWDKAKTLDEAQEHKLDLICRKLNLQKGQRVLDIGSGWGSFAKYAAKKYGVSVVGVTISKEQMVLARKLCDGLPVEFRLQDYRDIDEKFDHIVSVGMFEHVGYKNYRTYMKVAERCLKDGGLFLLHTIGSNKSVVATDPWIDKYIFPNGMLPSIKQISGAIENLFVVEDWHNFGADYDKTLMFWRANFIKHWPELKSEYSERFYRMWNYYLLSCAGSFRARENQLWQIVLSKNGVEGGYRAVR
ncbi:MAG: cyclopropane fatty acyl phospholipid synthase [Candidatus Paceibacterota bacterium]|jgi:cyclopropane-fatty-acyl-phospholipid synthase